MFAFGSWAGTTSRSLHSGINCYQWHHHIVIFVFISVTTTAATTTIIIVTRIQDLR